MARADTGIVILSAAKDLGICLCFCRWFSCLLVLPEENLLVVFGPSLRLPLKKSYLEHQSREKEEFEPNKYGQLLARFWREFTKEPLAFDLL